MKSEFPFILRISALKLPVYIGVGEAERSAPTLLTADIEIAAFLAPDAVRSDSAHYLCYDALCQLLLQKSSEKPYHLLEFLAGELLRVVREAAPDSPHITLTLHKPLAKALVGYDVGGASVTLVDVLS